MADYLWSARTAGSGRRLPKSTPDSLGNMYARWRRAGVGKCTRPAAPTKPPPVPLLPVPSLPYGHVRVHDAAVTLTVGRPRRALTMKRVVARVVPSGGGAAAQRALVHGGNSFELVSAVAAVGRALVVVRSVGPNIATRKYACCSSQTVNIVEEACAADVLSEPFRLRDAADRYSHVTTGSRCLRRRSKRGGRRRGRRTAPQAHDVDRTETLRNRATRRRWRCAYELLVFLDGAARRGRMSSPQVVEVSYAVVDVSCAVRDIRAPLRLLFAGWLTRVWLHGAVATRCAPRTCSMQCVCLMRYRSAPALQLCPPRTARDFDRQMRVATRSVATE